MISTIWLLILSGIDIASGQEGRNYYSLGCSFQRESVEETVLGDLKYIDFQIQMAFIRRINQSLPFNVSEKKVDLGIGLRGLFSQSFLSSKQLTQSNSAFEIAPVVRFFLFQKGFLEVGYSIKYFLYGHVFIRDSSSGILVNIPSDKGYDSGLILGVGYLLDLNNSVSIEPRIELNFSNLSESETSSGISEDVIRNIRFIIGINLVRSK
jgi:hypothetical protein